MTWATRDRAEAAEARVKELEAEVKALKRELAARPKGVLPIEPKTAPSTFGFPRPAPKPGSKKR